MYKRYRNKELFVTVSLFNAFLLMIIMAMVRTNFNIATGFGLFALLSMITLRSAPFTKAEMAYLFGGVSLAVINGAGIENITFVLMCNISIILCAFVISTWAIEHSASIIDEDNIENMAITLDHIDEDVIKNHRLMKRRLCELLKLNVLTFSIKNIDYVKDLVDLVLTYELAEDGNPQFAGDRDSRLTGDIDTDIGEMASREIPNAAH